MLDHGHPDVVLAFHNDLENSKGTKHMVKIALESGVPVYLNGGRYGEKCG
jgi:argininosuccinate synthase